MLPRSTKLIPKVSIPTAIVEDVISPWRALDDRCKTSPESRASIAVVDSSSRGVDAAHSVVEFSYRALRLEARTLASQLEQNHGIRKGDSVCCFLDNTAASIIASYAIAGLGARRVDINTRLSARETASRLKVANVRVIIAGDAYANKIASAVYSLMIDYSDLNGTDEPMSILYAAAPGASSMAELALPNYDTEQLAEFMDMMVESTRLCFDVYSAHRGGVDVVSGGGTDTYDAFLSESDEPCLGLLSQLERGDALCWTPRLAEEALLDCDFQVMFTSGTTGAPKVVTHTQRQVMLHAKSVAQCCAFASHDVWLHVAPLFHAMDAFAMYACVLVGAKQVCTASEIFDVKTTLQTMKDAGVTLTALTSTHLRMLVSDPAFAVSAKHLRMLSVGGSAVPVDLVASLKYQCPQCTYFTDYGATEACGKICTTLGAPSSSIESLARAGHAMPLFDVCVVKDSTSMESVEWNDVTRGEVLVRGPTVIGTFDGKWHTVGDVATVDASGSVKIVDRLSDIIIVGGENVYSSEVEAVLLERPEIEECAVFGMPDKVLGEVVCAAIVLDSRQASLNSSEVTKHCSSRLADFKRPQRLTIVESLPKSPTGKVLKLKLQAQLATRSHEDGTRPHAELSDVVRQEFIHAMDWNDDREIDTKQTFSSLGVRSTQAVSFASLLSDRLGLDLPSTLMFDHPNLNSVINFVAGRTMIRRSASSITQKHAPLSFSSVFVTEISDEFPHGEIDAQTVIPLRRFDVEHHFSCGDDFATAPLGSIDVRFAALLANFDEEDLLACELSPVEASYVDPQHRILLRQTLPVLHFSNQSADVVTGVFVGCMWADDYSNVLSSFQCVFVSPNATLGIGSGLAFLSGRISFSANLSGPAIGCDTACSSSLVACSLGLSSMMKFECDSSLCAGTNLLLFVNTHSKICRLNALAMDGRCKTLDYAADGYGRSEGVGSCLLSVENGNPCHGTLVYVGVNQDARSAALVAPRGAAQSAVIAETCSRCVGQLTVYELHGTGTQLGDPIEISALREALECTEIDLVAISITSVKASFGHSEGSAGIAGLLSAIISDKNRQRMPIHHLIHLNPHVAEISNGLSTPFSFGRVLSAGVRINQRNGRGEHSGVSAFGMSGTNASALLRSAVRSEQIKRTNRRILLDLATWCSIDPPTFPALFSFCVASDNVLFQIRIDARIYSGAFDMSIQHMKFFPSGHCVETARQCASTLGQRSAVVNSFTIHSPLRLAENRGTDVVVTVDKRSGFVTTGSADALVKYATCRFTIPVHSIPPKGARWNAVRATPPTTITASIQRTQKVRTDCIDPIYLESLFQINSALRLGATLLGSLNAYCTLTRFPPHGHLSVTMAGECGNLASATRMTGLTLHRVRANAFTSARRISDMLYHVSWCAAGVATASGRTHQSLRLMNLTAKACDAVCAGLSAIQSFDDASISAVSAEVMPLACRGDALLALVRTAAQELPTIRFAGIRCAENASSYDARAKSYAPGAACDIKIDAQVVYEQRLSRVNMESSTSENQTSYAVLITGGLGGVGFHMAKWLLSHESSSFTNLLSRIGRQNVSFGDIDGKSALIIRRCDLSDHEDVVEVLKSTKMRAPLRKILHASGIILDNTLAKQNHDGVKQVFAAKVSAFENIEMCVGCLEAVHTSVVCSSIASTFGSPGQSNYSAANAVLDFYAISSQYHGRPLSSVQWGAWCSVGMASRGGSYIARAERVGFGTITPDEGVDVLRRIFTGWTTSIVASPFDWNKMVKNAPMFTMLESFLGTSGHKIAQPKVIEDKERIRFRVRSIVESILGGSPDADAPLASSGLDSLSANELKMEIDAEFGVQTPATLVYDYPSINTLSACVVSVLQPSIKLVEEYHSPQMNMTAQTDICGVILGGDIRTAATMRFPVDAISIAPYGRWDNNFWMDARNMTFPFSSAFMVHFTEFDNDLFGIPGVETLLLDPQQRTLLEGAFAVVDISSQQDDTTVWVGITVSQYKTDVINVYWAPAFHSSMGTGSLPSVAAGRLSYVFSMSGASMSVDTACSSSLVACSLAFDSLRKQCLGSSALVCGTVAMMSVSGTIDRHYANMLSVECRCKTLDASADGFIEGEATGIMSMTSALRASGEGVSISGTAVNQDGHSASLTAPNGPAQTRVIREALCSANMQGEEMESISLHGTGTPLGDPIELGAALGALQDCKKLMLDAVKSHVGHCETAAGIVALLRAHATVSDSIAHPVLHLRSLNQHCSSIIQTSDTNAPIVIPRQKVDANFKTMGISAFAFQGTNAHAIQRLNSGTVRAAVSRFAFHRREFWPLPTLHPHILSCTASTSDFARFCGRVEPRGHAHLLDHVVAERPLYPGAGFQELCAASARLMFAINVVAVESVVPAPLVMRTRELTLFTVSTELRKGEIRIQTKSGAVTHTKCFARRACAQPPQQASLKLLMKSVMPRSCASVHVPDWHLGYVVHPASLDASLQLAAVVDLTNTEVKVPVGAKAYVSVKSSSNAPTHFASLLKSNHSLERSRIVGLQVKTMRRTASRAAAHTPASKDTYTLRWFVVRSTGKSSKRVHLTLRKWIVTKSVTCATIGLAQNLASSRAAALNADRARAMEAVRAIVRTVAQEVQRVQFESTRHRAEDSHYVERSSTAAFVQGAPHEVSVDALALSEPRLRRAVVVDKWSRKHHLNQRIFARGDTSEKYIFITGGLGAIGMEVAREFERRSWRVVLLSRNGRAQAFGERRGSLVNAIKCDTSCSDSPSIRSCSLFCVDNTERYVLHAAGVLCDALLNQTTARSVFATMGAKLLSSNLAYAEVTRAVVLCSSIAALTGNPGQTNYAAANALLDADAREQRSFGDSYFSVQWGGWANVGMAASNPAVVQRLVRIGAGAVDPKFGVDIIVKVFHGLIPHESIAVSPFNWRQISKSLPAFGIFKDVVECAHSTTTTEVKPPRVGTSALAMQTMSKRDVEIKISSLVRALVGREVAVNAPLMEAGLDSQAAGELKNELDVAFGVEVPAVAVYDYPTIAALSSYIASGTQIVENFESSPTVAEHFLNDVVAHISGAELLVPTHSGDGITRVPMHRWDNSWWWDREQIFIPSFSGFLIGYELFDTTLFGIASTEALLMDVQQRSILEGVASTRLASHEIKDDALEGDSCGVYVAISSMQYQVEVLDKFWSNQFSPYIATGNTLSVAAGRVSFIYGLRGPSFSIDTACSTSIVATHLCVEGLRSFDCTSGIVAGVISILGPGVTTIFFSSGMLSQSGRCKTLDASADGYVRGEARGVFLVHGMESHAISSGVAIVGSSINQDGRSSGLTAPNGPSQQAVMKQALRASRGNGAEIDKLQMHGTGTPLGDPIEVGATAAVLQRQSGEPLTLEAIKSHVGHTETASGMVALMQPLLSLVDSDVEKILHLRWVNPHIASIVGKGAFVSSPRQNFPRNAKLAGVSSFAFQGTNANSIQRVTMGDKLRHPIVSPAFVRETFYPLPKLHPQIHAFSKTFKRGDTLRFCAKVNVRTHAHLLHHRVFDRALYPGAGFQELAGGAARTFDAKSATILNSAVPAPLQMSLLKDTVFDVRILAPSGRLDVHSANIIFMKCCVHLHDNCRCESVTTSSKSFTKRAKTTKISLAKIHSLTTERHVEYFVHPACLDSTLQLGAVMNAGSSETKVPVGVHAYAAQQISVKRRSLHASASNSSGNYVLERANVVGLELKPMRRGKALVTKQTRMLYALRWFALQPCVPGQMRAVSDLESCATCGVLTAACAVQCNTATGIKIETIRTTSNDALHGFARTVGQEIKQLRTESVRFDDARTRYVASADASLKFVGESHDVLVQANMTYESRVRKAQNVIKPPSRKSLTLEVRIPRQAPKTLRVMITGGLGAIGVEYATHVNSSTIDARVRLLGRSGRGAEFDGRTFSSVHACKCDAGFSEDVKPVVYHQCDEILHAAGVLRDGLIRFQSALSVRVVIGAKVNSWQTLESHLVGAMVRRIVHCSSIAALTGSSGQSNYSAANACLDSIADFARFRGDSISSMQFGAWSNAGMAEARVLEKVNSMGFGVVTPELGMRALERVMSRQGIGNVIATPYDFKKFAEALPVIPRMYRDVAVKQKQKTSKKQRKHVGGGAARLSVAVVRRKIQQIATQVIGREIGLDEPLMDAGLDSLGGQEMKAQIEDEFAVELPATAAFDYPTVSVLGDFVAGELGAGDVDEDEDTAEGSGISIADVQSRVLQIACQVIGRDVDPNEPLMDSGLDSLGGQEMKQQIEDEFDIELPPTVVFDYPTIKDLATFVADEIGATAATKKSPTIVVASSLKHVAVRNFDLTAPHPPDADAIRRVPYHRWDHDFYQEAVQEYHSSRVSGYNLHVAPFGGFMTNYISFDNRAFAISALEALYMDVQQRSLLEGTFQATTAGTFAVTSEDTLEGSLSSGVWVGIAACDYADEVLRRYEHALHPYLVSGTSLNVAAGRISYVFNFKGPSVSVDTACSSSIVTTHSAFISMRSSEIGRAVSCGVQAILSEHITGVFHSSGMLAPDGRCKTLDASADGYVRGEARGVLALEAVDASEAVNVTNVLLAGAAVNQDGRSSSLTAPNGPTQKTVIRAAISTASAMTRDVDVLQLHGTGTALGDPIEIGAALSALERLPADRAFTLEAVKTHVGHTETAAGAVSLVQETKKLAGCATSLVAHLRLVSPHLLGLFASAQTNGTHIARQFSARLASLVSVSGFAFQGTNANAVLRLNSSKLPAPRHCPKAIFHRSRFWPLPELHVHLKTFDGSNDAVTFRFTACVDARLHSHLLGCKTSAREAIFPSAGFLELACAASRIFDREPMACDAAVFAPLALRTNGVYFFTVAVNAKSGEVEAKESLDQGEACMQCRVRRTDLASRRTAPGPVSSLLVGRSDSSNRTVRARVKARSEQSHFEYRIDPCALESSFAARSAMRDPGVLRACARHYTTPRTAAMSMIATICDHAHTMNEVYTIGVVFKRPFDRVYRLIRQTFAATPEATTSLRREVVAPLPPLESLESIQRKIYAHCSRITGASSIAGGDALVDLGMDSLAAAELRAAIQNEFGMLLPIHAAFECPTADALASYIVREHTKKRKAETAGATRPASTVEGETVRWLVVIAVIVVVMVLHIVKLTRAVSLEDA